MLVWGAKAKRMSGINPESFLLMMRIKLRQLNKIISETFKLKFGLVEYNCGVRNLLHVFGGELELHCDIDISNQITRIARLLETTNSEEKWNRIISEYLDLYELVLKFCS